MHSLVVFLIGPLKKRKYFKVLDSD